MTKKKVLTVIAIFIIIILSLTIVIWKITANYPWDELIIKEIESNLNGRLSIGNISLKLSEATLQNISITSSDGEEIFKADMVTVSYNPENYLKYRKPLRCISRITIINPVVKAICSSEGRWNWQDIFKQEKEKIIPFNGNIEIKSGKIKILSYKEELPLNLEINNLTAEIDLWANPVINFKINTEENFFCIKAEGKGNYITSEIFVKTEFTSLDIAKWGQFIKIKDMDLTEGRATGKLDFTVISQENKEPVIHMDGHLEVKDGTLDYFKKKISLNHINGKILFNRNNLSLSVSGKRFDEAVTISGKITDLPGAFLNLYILSSSCELNSLIIPFLPEIKKYNLKGKASLEVTVKGTEKKPFVMVHIKSPQIKIKDKTLKDITIKGSFLDNKIRMEDIKFFLGEGKIVCNGFAGDVTNNPSMSINLDIQKFELHHLSSLIPEIEKYNIKGNLNCKTRILGTRDNPFISANIESHEGINIMGIPLEDFEASLNYCNETVNITELNAGNSSGGLELKGQIINIGKPLFYFYLKGTDFNLNNIKPLLPQGTFNDFYGRSDFIIDIAGEKDNFIARGFFENSSITAKDHKIEDLRGSFEYIEDFLILHDLYGLWYGNPIVGRGTIYTKEAKTIELFLSSPQIKPESLSYFYPDLEAYKLHGNIIFDALIRGDISEPVTAINVEVPSITTKEYTLENFNFYGYLQGKNLCIKNLKGSIKGYPYEKNHLSFEGNMFLSKNSNGFLGSIAITSEGGIWKGVSLGSIDSYGYMLKDKLFIDHFNVLDIGEKGNLYTMGYISNREISLNYWTDDLPLELFNKLENIPYKLYGNVMVNGMIKGSPAEPQIDGHIAIKTARAGDLKFSLSSEFYMDKKKLSFSDFSLLRENGMYNMDGEIKLQKPWNITLNIGIEGGRISQWKELSALLSEMKIDGKIKAAISLEGKLEDLLKSTSFNDMDLNNMDIKGEVSIFNSKIKDANIDVITTEFALEEGIINLSNCTAAHKNSSLQAKGTYNMKNKELSLNFVSPRFYFEDFKEILKGNILKGRGQLRGSFLGTKEDFKGWSEFQLLSPEYKGHMVDWSTGNLEFNKNDVTIKSLHIKKNNDLYQISGNMSLKEDPELFLILNAYNVKIENFLEVADIKKLPPIKGKFSTQAHLRGTLHEPVLSVVIKTNNISINTFPIENLTAEFNLTGKEIHIGTLEVNSEKMRLTGYGHIDMDKDTNLTLEGKNISLDLIEKSLMLHEKLNLEGKLDLNLQATGPTDKINLIGSFQVRDAMFNNYSISRIRSLISYDGSILQIKSLDFVEKDFNLFAKGDIPLEFNDNRWICPGPMDIGITTSANDLSVINAFNSDFEGTHGEIKSDLHIGGTLFEPQLNGEISVKDGIIIHKVSKEPLKNFNMSLSIDNRSITLKNLEGNLGEGIVNAKGVLHLENFRPEEIALSLSGERLLLDLPDYLKSEVSFKSSLKGKCQEPLFSGDIILNNYSVELYPGIFSSSFTPTSASSKIDDLFQTIQPEFKLEEQEKTVISKTDFSDMIKLNFNIKIGDDYWIKSNIFQMRLKGDVKLGGTISSPTLEGDINIPTGSLSLLGTKFDIKDSSLSFEKENGILPVLSLRASTYLQGYAILVDSYGLLPDKVTTTYRSDPPTSRDDLNRLLSPGSDTIGKQDVFKDAILNFATSTVTPFVFNPLEDTFRKGFGLDIFNIQLSPTGGLGLEIGKEFTDWFRLTYRIYNQDEMTVLNSRRYYVEREVLNLQFKIKEHSNFNIGTNTAGDFTSHVEVNYRF